MTALQYQRSSPGVKIVLIDYPFCRNGKDRERRPYLELASSSTRKRLYWTGKETLYEIFRIVLLLLHQPSKVFSFELGGDRTLGHDILARMPTENTTYGRKPSYKGNILTQRMKRI